MPSQRVPAPLLTQYRDHGIALFLGAGVSLGSCLPSWEDLLKRIYNRISATLPGSPSYKLLRKSSTLVVTAGILERLSRSAGTSFAQIVRETLYRDFAFYSKDVRQTPYRQRFLTSVHRKNPTLRAVASICASANRSRFVANPRIRAVVNFNLDAVLRSYASAKYGLILRTIERPSAGPRLGRINVYYPHGFLDFDQSCIDDLRKESPDRLVLGEGAYFDLFNRPTELFTYTLLTLLREHTCLFVGMSMQDENVRRLLHYSFQERLQSYRVEGHDELKGETRALRHYAVLQTSGNSNLDDWQQQSLTALGVQAIFIRQFSQIPALFRSLYKAAGGKWNSVW